MSSVPRALTIILDGYGEPPDIQGLLLGAPIYLTTLPCTSTAFFLANYITDGPRIAVCPPLQQQAVCLSGLLEVMAVTC